MTHILGKRLEKVIAARLTCEHDHQGFDEQQFTYLVQRSSIQAVLSLAEVIKRNTPSQTITGALFFNFSDAFGSVNRMKLLYKLRNNYSISHRLFLYLVSFLFSRKARVTVNTLIGDWIESEYGTSAGTILVALLFIAYVQDMPICIHLKFADDLVGFRSAKDVATVEESLQRILNELSARSVEWDMQLNITKTKVVLF